MHFLQSPAWQSFQESLGRTTFRESGNGWQYLAILEKGTGNTRLYCPYGPYAEHDEAFDTALRSLIDLGKKHGATFVRIEPTNTDFLPILTANKWKKITYQSLNPEHTSVIDLAQSEDDLVAAMAQPVRNIYRNYQKKSIHVETSQNPDDISVFLELIHQVAQRTGMRPHSDDYFKAQATALLPSGAGSLWIARHEGAPIAASLMYQNDSTRYYAHAAASALPHHRKLNAGTALLAEAIVDAKHQGLAHFDLYGIAHENDPRSQAWAGFTKFKRTFGGSDVSFCGSWELPLNKPAYYLYRTYQKLRG